ncbi:MAG: hypothetical protein KDI79_25800 [Anaerolineae bacterium]|nr:hypothetical protein [Anaerolineae bacterium]
MANIPPTNGSNKKWTAGLLIILVLLGWASYQIFFGHISHFKTIYYSPLYSTNIYSLAGNAQVTQEFEADYPGLYRIDLYFEPQANSSSGEVVLHLKQQCKDPADIKTFVVNPSNIVSPWALPFVFSPLDDSAGQHYCLVLESQSTAQNASLGVYASEVDVYPGGDATYKSNTVELPDSKTASLPYRTWLPLVQKAPAVDHRQFDIGFNLYYNGSTGAIIQTLLGRLAANKPGLFGQPMFYLLLLLSYGGLLVGLWVAILKEPRS